MTVIRLANWIRSDGLLRTEDEIFAEMMDALVVKRRGPKIVPALNEAIRMTRN